MNDQKNDRTIEDEMDFMNDTQMMALFFELHNGNPREGPGDNESTLKALTAIPNLPEKPKILDVGCGPGMQTFVLAEKTGGMITALDNNQPFLDALEKAARERNLNQRIQVKNGSMFELPFEPESFDLIWSEGAIYIIGFEKGLKEWGGFLRSGGYLVASHIAWLREDVPKELLDWWKENYPGILTVKENIGIVEANGYRLIDHFTLPESSWWENYYDHLKKGFVRMQEKYPDDEKVAALLQMEEEEQRMYREYSDYYGYEFFIMQRE